MVEGKLYKVYALKTDYDSLGKIVQWTLAYYGRAYGERFEDAVDAVLYDKGITDRKVNGFPLFSNSADAENFVRLFNERRQ